MTHNVTLLRTFMEEGIPFNRWLGIKLRFIDSGEVHLALPFRPELIGDPFRPALHGGVLSTLIDTCGGAAAFSAIEEDQVVSTVDLRVDYLRPGPPEDLLAKAKVLRRGNRVCVVQVDVFSEGDPQAIATGRAVFNIVDRKGGALEVDSSL